MSTVSKSIDLGTASATQYLSRADAAGVRVVNGWTVEFLILLNTPNANAYIAYSRSGENGWGITLANTSGENYVIRVEAGSGSFSGANGTVNIYDGKMHHVRVYFNGSSTKLYIDGVLDSTLNIPTISNPNQTVYFGTKALTAGTYLCATLGVIRIWNNEHTASDQTTVYGSAQTNMQAEWSLDGVLTDASGNGLTLTATANSGTAPTYITTAHQDMQVGGRIYVGHHDDSNGVQSGTTTNTKEIKVGKNGSTIVVLISSATAGDNHGTPTLEGVNMTQVESAITGTNRRGTLWYIPNISAGSQTLSISPSSISNRYSWGFVVLENVATSSPVDVSGVGGQTTATSRTATLSLTQANSAMIMANYNLYDAGTNSTKLFGTGDDQNLFSNCDEKTTGNFSMTATSSSSENAFIAVAFKVGSQTYNQSVIATTAITAAVVKQIPKTLVATSTITGNVFKNLSKTLVASATATASMVKQMSKSLIAEVAVSASMIATKVYLQALTATANVSAAITKIPGKILTATSTVSASIEKTFSISMLITATASITANVVKGLSKTIIATTNVSGVVLKTPAKTLTAITTVSANVSSQLAKILVATATITADIVAGRAVIMIATANVAATITKTPQKILVAITSIVAKIRAPFYRTKYPSHGDGSDYEVKYPHDTI